MDKDVQLSPDALIVPLCTYSLTNSGTLENIGAFAHCYVSMIRADRREGWLILQRPMRRKAGDYQGLFLSSFDNLAIFLYLSFSY
jgi:hypothetical protein